MNSWCASMFDILVYLFENYVHAAACPASDQLARKLSAAGFEEGEISDALEWLSDLRSISGSPMLQLPSETSMRVYAFEEQGRLNVACRGFLGFLETAGVLDARTRELIIERALALAETGLNLHRLKIIVLMVLWQQERTLDTLILDELLTNEEEEVFVTLH